MTAARVLSGFGFALVTWFLATVALSSYEGDVRVLRPRTRALYGACAALAGLLLGAKIAGLL